VPLPLGQKFRREGTLLRTTMKTKAPLERASRRVGTLWRRWWRLLLRLVAATVEGLLRELLLLLLRLLLEE